MNTSPSGRLIVISGPSGVGKTTIVESILESTPSVFSVSATTRSARSGEVDGVDYHFVDRGSFKAMVASGEILEWAEYGGNLYGTLRSSVQPILESGRNVILDIENEGAKQIRASCPEALLIFVVPPDLETLAGRLAGRGDTAQSDMALRLAVAVEQIAEAPEVYDHIVENADLEHATKKVLDIVGAEGTVFPVQ
ncbi:MAG: guanylate kinase [Actinobacteria bacterium]|nr:MAG: guanylate kinase [Actinomycetota bacterium]